MTTQTPAHAHHIWKDARPIVSAPKPRPAHVEPPKPAPPAQVPAEKEADRWVAQMMFENYNP